MTDDQVKHHLRQAVTTGIVWGWYKHHPHHGNEWVINPAAGPCVSMTPQDVRDYCTMLASCPPDSA